MRKLFFLTLALATLVSCGDKSSELVGSDGSFDVEFDTPFEKKTPYITKVYDFVPAPGQHVNMFPKFNEGETKEDILAKIEAGYAGKGHGSLVSLGGFGGYIVFGFDHSVDNKIGLCDLRIYGNAFNNSPEPGIVMVSRDDNGNGIPDDEWYEIKGSDHDKESTISDYEITYTYIVDGSTTKVEWADNQGGSGSVMPKFPGWISGSELKFKGTRLADAYTVNNNFWTGVALNYGYVDNQPNASDKSAIDISWAVDAEGNPANLDAIDFVKVYNSQRMVAGWLGDVSTDICGAEDLHLLSIKILSAEVMAE